MSTHVTYREVSPYAFCFLSNTEPRLDEEQTIAQNISYILAFNMSSVTTFITSSR